MRDDRDKWTRRRIYLIGGVFAFILSISVARAFYLQIYEQEKFARLAEKQHLKVVQLTPSRGAVYDATNSALAVSIEMDSLYAEPRNVEDQSAAAAQLAPLLGTTKEALEKKMKASKGFAWLARRLTPEVAAQIRKLDIDGIGFVKEPKRFYPNAEIGSHVIGFTGLDPEGLEGVEKKFDTTLLGNTGYMVTERDALGRDIGNKGMVTQNASTGQNLVLTLDKNIQYIAEKELAAAVENSRAKGGIAVVMEPASGKILAMANYPTFNPNSFGKFPPNALRNKAITDSFEPGSTMKVFLIAAALEEKSVKPEDGFNCENGSYNIGGRTIHDTHKYGRLSVGDVLKYSSNIGAAKIGAKLGAERLYGYLRGFGFGARSNIDLPGEVSGYLRNKSSWYGVDLATISFGQGVSVSSLQLVAAMSAIANGGSLMQPYVVDRVVDSKGNPVKQFSPINRQKVISPETAKIVAGMMEAVAAEGGTGTAAAVDGFKVAGKTGTAQKADPVTKGYSHDKRTASFVGFVPSDNPRLTILVVVDEPKTSPYGGVVAAPAFSAIARQSLCYLRVSPNQPVKKKPAVIEVKKAEPLVAAAEDEDDVAPENHLQSGLMMANFRGMSMRQVLQQMEKKGLNIRLIGSGRVVEQNPPPGKKINPSDPVWVKLAPSA
ncbi:MAG: transpeptidase family protein [Geobacteraceae bacterium]|nr:transpeptidase family protein [Geobacteraceae bacterium]